MSAVRSLPDLLRMHAALAPDEPALVARDVLGRSPRRMPWCELDAAVNSAAAALRTRGAEPGDRVVLQLRTGADAAVLYLGALRAGVIAVPVNPGYTPRELDRICSDAGAKFALDDASGRALLDDAPAAPDPRADRHGEEVAVVLYTGGTSGQAKGAMLSTRALLANLEQIAALRPAPVRSDDVVFVPLPLTHIYGMNAAFGSALFAGARTVLADRFDPDATLATMAAEQVTVVAAVPAQFAAWLRRPGFADGFGQVRFAMSGSATLTRTTAQAYREAGVSLHDGYGLTEAAPVVTVDLGGVAGTVGRPLPGVDVEIRDDEGDVVEAGDPGRICVRGANLFSGYWPDGSLGPDEDGWFATGDLGVLDGSGNLRLVGRCDDLVIVDGFNVYPAEVEAVLAGEPGVAEVAVVGVAEPDGREAVHAYVVPAPGASLTSEELIAAAGRSLARFKLPSVLTVVPALPHSVTGKVLKWQLGQREAPDGAA